MAHGSRLTAHGSSRQLTHEDINAPAEMSDSPQQRLQPLMSASTIGAASNSAEEALVVANQKIKSLEEEVDFLRGMIMCKREDLNVKNEQFDFLYSSLRASTEQRVRCREREELYLRAQVAQLQLNIKHKDVLQQQTQQQLAEARRQLQQLRDVSSFTYARLPDEVLFNLFSFMPSAELARCGCVNKYWNAVSSIDALWLPEFRRRWGGIGVFTEVRDASGKTQPVEFKQETELSSSLPQSEISDADSSSGQLDPQQVIRRWKSVYRRRHELDENWIRARAKVSTLVGHSGTVTCLSLQGTQRMISGSDDGSMILYDLNPPKQDRPCVPAVALAGLIDSVLTSKRQSASSHSHTHSHVYGAGAGAELFSGQSRQIQRDYARVFSFHGHGGPVWCLDYSPERDLLVSGSYDRTIKLWSVGTGKCERTLRGHSGWVSSLALLIDHNRIVSASWDSTVKIWNLQSGACIRTVESEVGNALYCVSVSPDARTLGVGCRHCQVELYDIESGTLVGSLTGHSKEVYALQVSATTIFTGSKDNSVKMWDARSNMCALTFNAHTDSIMALQFDDAFRVVSGSYDKTAKLWDVRHPSRPLVSYSAHEGAIFCLKFDTHRLVTGSADHSIKLFNFAR